jgi:hypothetical protein
MCVTSFPIHTKVGRVTIMQSLLTLRMEKPITGGVIMESISSAIGPQEVLMDYVIIVLFWNS